MHVNTCTLITWKICSFGLVYTHYVKCRELLSGSADHKYEAVKEVVFISVMNTSHPRVISTFGQIAVCIRLFPVSPLLSGH